MIKKSLNLSTGIDGLDRILKWDNNAFDLNDDYEKNILIVIRGTRGISKVNLAMRMMDGINGCFNNEKQPRFFSLDKNNDALTKKYKEMFNVNHIDEDIFPVLDPQKEASYLYTKMLQFNAIVQDLSGENTYNCVVIDGFAGLSQEDFLRLPMDTLEELLKKKARVSILVFDDRLTNYSTGADIILELRRTDDNRHNYQYYELQIAKNFLNPKTLGWHKYHCTENGDIVVYPNIYNVLSNKKDIQCHFREHVTKADTKEVRDHVGNTDSLTLENCLCPKNLTTSIVGNNNTFKRRLAALSISKMIENGERVLVILLEEYRAGFVSLLEDVYGKELPLERLHLYELPWGCISSEEFLSMIQWYFSKYPNDRKNLFLIDVWALDYAFPMLLSETLFLPALTTVCHENRVGLTIVCDKKFSLVDEVCFVSDIVICTERENAAESNNVVGTKCLTLFLEKNPFGHDYNSKVFRLDITDIFDLTENLLNKQFNEEICTTKDYWRRALNIKNEVKIHEVATNKQD